MTGQSVATAVNAVLAGVAPGSSLTTSPTAWPQWADDAVGGGEPNAWFDPATAARKLSAAQREGLPSLVRLAESKLAGLNVDASAELVNALLHVALRVQPGVTSNAAQAWAASLVASLARLPADLVAKAVDEARHKQFQYLNEVGPWLEAHVAEPLRTRRTKLNRLREIELAAKAITAGPLLCTPEQAAEIAAQYRRDTSRAEEAKERPPVDWTKREKDMLADTNYLRSLHGLPLLDMDGWREERWRRLAKGVGRDFGERAATREAVADDFGLAPTKRAPARPQKPMPGEHDDELAA